MQPEQNTSDRELLTAKEAGKFFIDAGLSIPTFRRQVNAGQIESVMPEDRKRGALYPKDQVLAAIAVSAKANKPQKKKKVDPLKPSVFMQATPEDMPEMAKLLEKFYPRIDIKKRAAWIQKNPEIAFILRSENSEGEVVGCAFIMPLSEEKIFEILSNQVKPPTRPNEIPLYEAGKHYTLYIRAIGVKQATSKTQRRHWAARLINGLTEATIKLAQKGIYIDRVYAQGDTRLGEKTLRALGFMQIEIKAPTNRKNYMLDISKSGSVFAMRYKLALDIWRAQNEEE